MTALAATWPVIAVGAASATAMFVWHRFQARRVQERARFAERKLALLSTIAPSFTEAAVESVPQTCQRIVERFGSLVGAQLVLCLNETNGHLILGGKSDAGYAAFLRLGDPCDGDSIVDWVAAHRQPATTGPRSLTHECGGPLVGSRDRVCALCVPMLQARGYGLQPRLVGEIYAERPRGAPFTDNEKQLAVLVAQLAADALLRAKFADDVKRESQRDQLTGLLSPGAFRKRLREEIELRRYPSAGQRVDVAVFFIDTDRFKLWNDTFGHAVGDTLLRRLAETFREVAASGGFAGRNGGDEFCVALFERTKDDAVAVAEALRQRVERMRFVASEDDAAQPRISVTVSIGVAHFPVDVPATAEAPSDRLLEAADARMYDAKRDGRNLVAYARAHPVCSKK